MRTSSAWPLSWSSQPFDHLFSVPKDRRLLESSITAVAAGKDLNSLLGDALVTLGRVSDRFVRTVSEFRDEDGIRVEEVG